MIDAAAQNLVTRLERMLGVVEARERKAGEVAASSVPLCKESGLDFLTTPSGRAIGPKTSAKKYGAQLALCSSCGLRMSCLDRALTEDNRYGIWGGTMPKDR